MESYGRKMIKMCTLCVPEQRKKGENRMVFALFVEQGTGIEPASEAWEATIITNIRTLHRLLS